MRTEAELTRARGLVGAITLVAAPNTPGKDTAALQSALRTSLPLHSATLPGAGMAATEGVACLGNILAAVGGYPTWQEPELAAIAREEGHGAALAQAYQRHNTHFLGKIGGEFCAALYDGDSGTLIAATDRMGRLPLYYTVDGQSITFASKLGAVLKAGSPATEAWSQGIYDYVYFHMIPAPHTIYENVNKLQVASFIQINATGHEVKRYWQPRFGCHSDKSKAQLGAELKQTLREAVKRAAGEEKAVGAFLSGGLDSSTVAGMLAEISLGTAHAYSIGFSAEGYDEMVYARITAEHFGIKLHEYYVTPDDIVSALPDIARSYDEPFGNSSALPAWFCAKFAADNGVKRLLAGDGGDELFAGNERYAKQQIFEHYGQSPALLRHYIIEPIVRALPQSVSLVAKARSFLQQANTPLPQRLQAYNFLHRHVAEEIFTRDFLESVDASMPQELQRSIYNTPDNASTLDRMLNLDWQFTLADNDLRKVSQMCEKAGVDVTYPMLDDELVELSIAIPDKLKLKRGDLRHFYKESLRGWLPDATLNKEKHGFGLPFGVWMREYAPLSEMAYDNLVALKQRQFFRAEFIEHAIKLHQTGHASYYGELIWILMTLELWLQGR